MSEAACAIEHDVNAFLCATNTHLVAVIGYWIFIENILCDNCHSRAAHSCSKYSLKTSSFVLGIDQSVYCYCCSQVDTAAAPIRLTSCERVQSALQ